jgi:hypothetical protein
VFEAGAGVGRTFDGGITGYRKAAHRLPFR